VCVHVHPPSGADRVTTLKRVIGALQQFLRRNSSRRFRNSNPIHVFGRRRLTLRLRPAGLLYRQQTAIVEGTLVPSGAQPSPHESRRVTITFHVASPTLHRRITPTTLDDICGNAMKLQVAGPVGSRPASLSRDPGSRAQARGGEPLPRDVERAAASTRGRAGPTCSPPSKVNPELPDYWLGYLEGTASGRSDRPMQRLTLALGRQHGLSGAAVEEFAKRLVAHVPQSAVPESAVPLVVPPEPIEPPKKTARGGPVADNNARSKSGKNTLNAMLKQGRFTEGLAFARTLTEQLPERWLRLEDSGSIAVHIMEAPTKRLAAMQTAAKLMPRDA